MKITYERKVVSAFHMASGSYVPFYSVAWCELGGCILYFGGYDRKKGVTDVIEGTTGVRGTLSPFFRDSLSERERIEQLYESVVSTMLKSPFDMGTAVFFAGNRIPVYRRNFVEPWKISLISF